MISRRRMLAATMHLPLRQLALCLDCDECFAISSPTCPACGSATWTSLSRFPAQASSARQPGRRDAAAKRHDDSSEMVRQLIIVAGDRAHLYEHLERGFARAGRPAVGGHFGPDVKVWSVNHRFDDPDTPWQLQGWEAKEVVIEDDVWLGANVFVMPGVIIHKGAIISAGTVVNKSIPAFALVAGNPGRVVGWRKRPAAAAAAAATTPPASAMKHRDDIVQTQTAQRVFKTL